MLKIQVYLFLATFIFLLSSLIFPPLAAAGSWPDFSQCNSGNWQSGYYRPISVTNNTGVVANYQVAVTLSTAQLGSPYGRIKADGSDIRFTAAPPPYSGAELSYYIATWNNTGGSTLWVTVPNMPLGDSYLYMYYGNVSATAVGNTLTGTDHGGADWAMTDGAFGVHYNINNFTVAAGTYSVKQYDGSAGSGRLEVYANNATINGTLNAQGKGYAGGGPYQPGNGPGAGGSTYGSFTTPNDLGSGAGSGSNGASGSGGGLIKLFISGTLTNNGSIIAAGGNAPGRGGAGGSGGTLYISTGTLAGTGSINAGGGAANSTNSGTDGSAYGAGYGGAGGISPPGWYQIGGGGGGGRIAVYYTVTSYTGTILVAGGWGSNSGGAGTIYNASNQPTVAAPGAEAQYTLTNYVRSANWTSIVKAANPVAMGNAVAVISFTAVAAGTITTAHWRRFRIDETGGQPIEKLSVSVYEESGNDGFFDAADKFIASGTFNSSRTCILNMNRWPLGTTAKTYYIVEKVALDGSGGQTIRLNIVDGSYFDFEEGPCIGIPP